MSRATRLAGERRLQAVVDSHNALHPKRQILGPDGPPRPSVGRPISTAGPLPMCSKVHAHGNGDCNYGLQASL